MSSDITARIEAYRAGTSTLPQLVAWLADYPYRLQRRFVGAPVDPAALEDWDEAADYDEDGSWDEVARAWSTGLLSPAEYAKIGAAVDVAKGGQQDMGPFDEADYAARQAVWAARSG